MSNIQCKHENNEKKRFITFTCTDQRIFQSIFPLMSRFATSQSDEEEASLYTVLILSRFFTPLQGLFNIIIYCRPHVVSLRKKNPEYTLWKAFWVTVKTGGDHNLAGQRRRQRRSSQLGNKTFLEKLERDHAQRMENKRKRSRD